MRRAACQLWIVVFLWQAIEASSAARAAIDSEEAARACCERFKSATPVAEMPAAADEGQRWGSEDCLGFLYRSAGLGQDHAKARSCFARLRAHLREQAMLHANGWGGARDYERAGALLCQAESEMATAEWYGMLDHLERMHSGLETADLDYCQHVTSGDGGAHCATVAADRQAMELEHAVAEAQAAVDGAAEALGELRLQAEAFAEGYSELECAGSVGGSGYVSFCISARTQATGWFLQRLQGWTKSRAQPASAEAAKASDRELNATCRKVKKSMTECEDCSPEESDRFEGLRGVQLGWIAYRDAWAKFYALRWQGQAPEEELMREAVTALTKERTAQLAGYLEN